LPNTLFGPIQPNQTMLRVKKNNLNIILINYER
jgi:hypothetical protein